MALATTSAVSTDSDTGRMSWMLPSQPWRRPSATSGRKRLDMGKTPDAPERRDRAVQECQKRFTDGGGSRRSPATLRQRTCIACTPHLAQQLGRQRQRSGQRRGGLLALLLGGLGLNGAGLVLHDLLRFWGMCISLNARSRFQQRDPLGGSVSSYR